MPVPKCGECQFLRRSGSYTDNGKVRFLCLHRDMPQHYEIFFCGEEEYLPGFICVSKRDRLAPKISTSPKWCPLRCQEGQVKRISKAEAYCILGQEHPPRGMYFLKEGDGYTAVSTYGEEPEVFEFRDRDALRRWLGTRA